MLLDIEDDQPIVNVVSEDDLLDIYLTKGKEETVNHLLDQLGFIALKEKFNEAS